MQPHKKQPSHARLLPPALQEMLEKSRESLLDEQERKRLCELIAVRYLALLLRSISHTVRQQRLQRLNRGGKLRDVSTTHVRYLQRSGVIDFKRAITPLGRALCDILIYPKQIQQISSKSRLGIVLTLWNKRELDFGKLALEVSEQRGTISRSLKFLVKESYVQKTEGGYELTREHSIVRDLGSLYDRIAKSILSYVRGMNDDIFSLFYEGISRTEPSEELGKRIEYHSVEQLIASHLIVTYDYDTLSPSRPETVMRSILRYQMLEDVAKPVGSFDPKKLQIAYPLEHIASLQQLVNMFCIHGVRQLKSILVEDVMFPRSFTSGYGPCHGIAGLRQRLNVPHRPILQMIVPTNLKDAHFCELVKSALWSGIDELCDNHFFGCTLRRFRERADAIVSIFEKTGDDRLQTYYCYIEGADCEEKIDVLKETGCRHFGLGLSPLSFGLPLTDIIRRKYGTIYPLQLHITLICMFTALGKNVIAMSGLQSGWGISMKTLHKLFVLLGGDEINVDSSFLYRTWTEDESIAHCSTIRESFPWLRTPFPAIVGGIRLGNAHEIVHKYGEDVVIKIGANQMIEANINEGIPYEKSMKAYLEAVEAATRNEDPITEPKKYPMFSQCVDSHYL